MAGMLLLLNAACGEMVMMMTLHIDNCHGRPTVGARQMDGELCMAQLF